MMNRNLYQQANATFRTLECVKRNATCRPEEVIRAARDAASAAHQIVEYEKTHGVQGTELCISLIREASCLIDAERFDQARKVYQDARVYADTVKLQIWIEKELKEITPSTARN